MLTWRSRESSTARLAASALVFLAILALVAGVAMAHVKPWYEWCNDPATGKPKRTLKVWVDPAAGDDWKRWTQDAINNWNNANTGWTLQTTSTVEGAEVTVHTAPIPAYPDGSVSAGEVRTDYDGATGEVIGATITANSNLAWGTTGDDNLDPVKMLKHELGHTMRLDHSELGNLMEDSIGNGDHSRTPNNDDVDEAKEAASGTRAKAATETGDGRVRMIAGTAQLETNPLVISVVETSTGHPLLLQPMEGIMLPQPLAVPSPLGRVFCAAGLFPTQAEYPQPVAVTLQWTDGAVSGMELVGELHHHLLPPIDVSSAAVVPVVWRPDPGHTGTGTWTLLDSEILIDVGARTATFYAAQGGVYGLAAPYVVSPRLTGSVPFTDLTPSLERVVTNALAELRAMDIYRGYPDGTAQPTRRLTRLEFFTLAVRLAGGEQTLVDAGRTRPAFVDDIPEWGWASANQAVAMGLARGYPDGTFGPDRDVTGAEALAVLVRVLGAECEAVAAEQAWPTGYLTAANALGVLGELAQIVPDVDPWSGAPISRGEMAVLIRSAVWATARYDAGGSLVSQESIASGRNWWRVTTRIRAISQDGRRCVIANPVVVLGGMGFHDRFDLREDVYLAPGVSALPQVGEEVLLLGRGASVRLVLPE